MTESRWERIIHYAMKFWQRLPAGFTKPMQNRREADRYYCNLHLSWYN